MFRQGLCRGQAAAAGRPGSAGANGLRPFRRRRGAAGPAALLGKPAAPAGPPAAPAPHRSSGSPAAFTGRRHPQARHSSGRPAAFTGRRHPPAPRSPLQGPGSGRSPPPSGRQTGKARFGGAKHRRGCAPPPGFAKPHDPAFCQKRGRIVSLFLIPDAGNAGQQGTL